MSLWFFDGELNGAAKTTTHDELWQVIDATCRAPESADGPFQKAIIQLERKLLEGSND